MVNKLKSVLNGIRYYNNVFKENENNIKFIEENIHILLEMKMCEHFCDDKRWSELYEAKVKILNKKKYRVGIENDYFIIFCEGKIIVNKFIPISDIYKLIKKIRTNKIKKLSND